MIISDLFETKPLVKVCAPMVRYSKLEFRSLVRMYDCDLCFSPMIMADSFVNSEKARHNEFKTNDVDNPVIVQFAANNVHDFCEAAKLVCSQSSGVDLNCGCPQRWALKMGIGAHLLSEPETIKNIVSNVRNQISSKYSVSVKLRLLNDINSSVDLCRKLEKAGVTFLTVHGRTKEQKSQPINVDLLKDINLSLQIPLIANGDVKILNDVYTLQDRTGCKGVMAARGLLQNPSLFQGYNETPVSCIKNWIEIAVSTNLPFITFHHHLVFMLEKILPKSYRRKFNVLSNYQDVISFLNTYYDLGLTYSPERLKNIVNISNTITQGNYILEKINNFTPDDDILDDINYLYL